MGKDEQDIDQLLNDLEGEEGKNGKDAKDGKGKDKPVPPTKPPDPSAVKMPVLGEVDIDKLKMHSGNRAVVEDEAFAELVESIRAKGLLIPVVVNKKHEVVDGHRRIAACKKIGHKTVPFIVRDKDFDEATIIANYIRLNLTPEQVGEILERKKSSEKKTQEDIAKEIGLSQSRISQIIGKRKKAGEKQQRGPAKKKAVRRVALPAGVRVSVGKTRVEITFALDDEMLKHPEKSIVALFREVKGFAELIEGSRK